ncbi:Reverse transcriptase domain [Trinorchestia longiramus]|nr:Reverse transcriptase domain [Trinorchestia longiramus]
MRTNKHLIINYRTIRLIPVISKIMDRRLKVLVTKHLQAQNLIDAIQYGFREKRSYFTNLLNFFGEVNPIYSCTKATDLLYLDFQKAIDKVPHGRLKTKGVAHGIQGCYSRGIQN